MTLISPNIEKLQNDLSHLQINPQSPDHVSYPHFVNYFSSLDEIEEKDVIIGINFTYSWMPTILKTLKISGTVPILNAARDGQSLLASQIEELMASFNNSLVGTSKLLHFINPDDYAIWDSRIFKYLTEQEAYGYRMNDSGLYLEYLEMLNSLAKMDDYKPIHEAICEMIGYSVSHNRSLDVLMYTIQRDNDSQ